MLSGVIVYTRHGLALVNSLNVMLIMSSSVLFNLRFMSAPPLLQVSVEAVMKTFQENSQKAKNLLVAVIPRIRAEDWSETLSGLRVSNLFK